MIGSGADDPHPDTISLVPSGIPIDHIDSITRVQVVDGALTIDFPYLSQKISKRGSGVQGRPIRDKVKGVGQDECRGCSESFIFWYLHLLT